MNTASPSSPSAPQEVPQWVLNVTVADGKYTVRQHPAGNLFALRNGEPWQELTGNNLVLALAQAVAAATEEAERLRGELNKLKEENNKWPRLRLKHEYRNMGPGGYSLGCYEEVPVAEHELRTLRQQLATSQAWGEKAREAQEELCHDHRTPWKAKYDALLQSHPAATNLTEEGKK